MLSTLGRTSIYPLVLSLLLSFAETASAQEPRSYPLLCRGGGSNTLNFPPVQYAYGEFRGTVVNFSFGKSSRPATAGLQPGTCAWMDRGLNDNEPAGMIARFPEAFVYISVVYSNGQSVPTFAYTGSRDERRKLETLVTAITTGQEFQVHAYSDGSYLIVTKFGP